MKKVEVNTVITLFILYPNILVFNCYEVMN